MSTPSNNINHNTFDSTNLLVFLFKWKKPIIYTCLIAAVVSAGISLIIEEKFKSTVVVFPAATSSVSKALIAPNQSGKYDALAFGEEEQAEQMLQVLNSDEIRLRIINKYNLKEHYEIGEDEQYANTKLLKIYESNISFSRTKFSSVEIEVMDKNPQYAADMANDICDLVDTVMTRMQQHRAKQAFVIVEAEYNELVKFIREMEDSLTTLQMLGVNDYETQVEMYTAEYSKALVQGNSRGIKVLEEKLAILSKYGSSYVTIKNAIEFQSERLAIMRMKYKEARVDATTELPHKFVVNKAYPAEKKSYPIRWLIVVISTFAAFLISILAIIGIENYKIITEQKQ